MTLQDKILVFFFVDSPVCFMICVCFFLPDLEVITYLEPLEEISLASYECAGTSFPTPKL